jgi:hypothetical protein
MEQDGQLGQKEKVLVEQKNKAGTLMELWQETLRKWSKVLCRKGL